LLDRKSAGRKMMLHPFLAVSSRFRYEITGQVANVVFLEGLVFFRGSMLLYYGTADSKIAVATAPIPSRLSQVPTRVETPLIDPAIAATEFTQVDLVDVPLISAPIDDSLAEERAPSSARGWAIGLVAAGVLLVAACHAFLLRNRKGKSRRNLCLASQDLLDHEL